MLKIEVGDFVYLINRVRYVDKEPLVIEKNIYAFKCDSWSENEGCRRFYI